MNSNHTHSSIREFLLKASVNSDKTFAEVDLSVLKSLIDENSKLLDQYIGELRD